VYLVVASGRGAARAFLDMLEPALDAFEVIHTAAPKL
jgi:hypothetical protein